MSSPLFGLIFIWFCHFASDFFLGVWPIFKTMAHLDLAKAGAIMMISGFLGDGTQILFSLFSGQKRRNWMVAIGLILSTGTLFTPLTSNYGVFFLLVFICYLGSGAFHPAAASLAVSMNPARKGFLMTSFTASGVLGMAVSQLIFSTLYIEHGLNVLWVALVPAVLAVFAFFVYRQKQETHQAPVQLSVKEKLQDFFTACKPYKKEIKLLYVGQVLTQTLGAGFVFLLPDLLKETGANSWFSFGGGYLCYVLGGATMMVICGLLADKPGGRKVMRSVAILGVSIYYLHLLMPFAFPSIWVQSFSPALFLFAIGGCFGALNPLYVSGGQKLLPNHTNMVSALLMGGAWCVGYTGTWIAGSIASFFVFAPIAKSLLILGGLGLPIILILDKLVRAEKEALTSPVQEI